MKIYPYSQKCPKVKKATPPFPLLTKLLFLPLKAQVQRSAASRMGRSGLHVYQVTHFKDILPYTASDESKGAKDRATLSFCYYHHCQGMDGSFFSIIISLFFSSINNGSEEYDPFLWIFWMAPNVLQDAKVSLVCQLLRMIHRWHCWLMLWVCYQHCKHGGGGGKSIHLKLINSRSEKKRKNHLRSSVICQI